MSDPVTMMVISTVAAGAIEGFGQMQSANNKARLFEREGEIARQQSQFNADRQAEQDKRDAAQRFVSFAKGGTDISAHGTSTLIQEQEAETDALNISAILAGGKNVQSSRQFEADITRSEGRSKGVGTLITAGIGAANASGAFTPASAPSGFGKNIKWQRFAK